MKSANEIINDPIKSTLFGKFYEKIILHWLSEKKGFVVFEGKPRVYWKDVDSNEKGSYLARKLNETLENVKNSRQYCTPDGFLQKDERYYVWEAKNWPLWSEGKKPLDQLRDLLFSMPFILTIKAVYRTRDYEVSGFLFSWWSKPAGVESLLEDINSLIAPRTFEIFYTADIIEDCIKNRYSWYLQIVNVEKARIYEFFEDLLGQSALR